MTINHMHAPVSNLLTNIVHTWARWPAPAKFQLLADIEIPSAMGCRMRCNTLSHSRDIGCNLVSPTLEGCEKCQRYGKDHHPTIPVQPQEVPEGPWQTIGVDLITGLPMSHGKNAIMTVVDHFTKQVHLYPVTNSITADRVADIYFHKTFPLHGFPKKIISD